MEHDHGVKYAWYITDEGSLPNIGMNPRENEVFGQYLSLSMEALYAGACASVGVGVGACVGVGAGACVRG